MSKTPRFYDDLLVKITQRPFVENFTANQQMMLVAATKTHTFKFNPNQPRDHEGRWTDTGLGDVFTVMGKKITPAVIYKKHADGTIVAEAGNERMRWNAGGKKFVVEKRSGGDWQETTRLTKTAAYEDVKRPNRWFEPGSVTAKSKSQVKPEPVPVIGAPGQITKITSVEDAQTLRGEVTGDDDRDEYMRRALDALDEFGPEIATTYVVRDENGKLTGAMTIVDHVNSAEKDGLSPYSVIDYIGARGDGAGRKLVKQAIEHALDTNTQIYAEPTEMSAGFWEKIGFHEDPLGEGVLFVGLTHDEAVEWPNVSSQTPEPAPAVAEPTAETLPLASIAAGAQKDAVGAYRIAGNVAVNRQLRTGVKQKLISMDTDELIAGLDSALAQELNEDVIAELTAAAEIHTGAMIALVPREKDAARLAVDGGEDADQLHVTLLYLGEAVMIPAELRECLIDCVSAEVMHQATAIGDAFAVSIFNPEDLTTGGGEPCVVLQLSGTQLRTLHERIRLVAGVKFAQLGVQLPQQHDPWIPHMTLVYTPEADLTAFTDRIGPVTFDAVRLAFGGEIYDIPLGAESVTAAFDPNQPRDSDGQWTDGKVKTTATTDMFDDMSPNWSDEQRHALRRYIGANYEKINMHLRGEMPEVEPVIKKRIEILHGMMRPTSRPTKVYRGISLDAFGDDTTHENLPEKLSGNIITHKGFTSTSRSRSVVEDNFDAAILLVIDVPQGSPAVWVGGEERELLLNSDTQLQVQSVDRNHKYQTTIHVKVIV